MKETINNSSASVQDIFGFAEQYAATGDRCGIWDAPLVDSLYVRRWKLSPQYFSPNRRGLRRIPDLYVCDLCGTDFLTENAYASHSADCAPPIVGREIYRDDDKRIIITEAFGVDERAGPVCQRFTLLAKHFLDHKETFLDVESFTFYFLFEVDSEGLHFSGYFSRDRQSQCLTSLACIAVLPPYQSTGYGSLLIRLSYELLRRDSRVGSPERPFTVSGRQAFSAAWRRSVSAALVDAAVAGETLSLRRLAIRCGMIPCDLLATLESLDCVKERDGTKHLTISSQASQCAKIPVKIAIDPSHLHW
jgi:histone acetyltransferase HTATIP